MTSTQLPAPTVANWLAELGLGDYADGFRSADIDFEVLPLLTDTDLKELGVRSLGHRRKILARLSRMVAGETIDLSAAEMRYLTVMFCDLVGSTRLSMTLGAERFTELLDGFYRAVNLATDPFGGHIAQYHGDGVLVYFGYPKAVEDAALRCVVSACRVVAAVADLSTPDNRRVAARIGVASGVVVVNGQRVGRPADGGRAFGATVNLAARIQAEAEPGMVAVADSTAALVQDQFDLRPLGPRRLKGIDAPCCLFEVLAQRSDDLGAAMLPKPERARFVGRQAELLQLAELWTRVTYGNSCAVAVVGEPGIGKTRLISEFLMPLSDAGHPVRRVVCEPQGQNVPFHAFLRALRCDRQGAEDVSAQIMNTLDVAAGGTQAERRQHRAQLVTLLLQHFAGECSAPRAIWFEDLHWADPSTIDTLSALITSRSAGLLVIASIRGSSPVDDLWVDTRMASLVLSPLDTGDTGHIIRDILSNTSGYEDFVPTLAARAEGVPIFAEELAAEMRARLAASGNAGPVPNPAHLISSSLQQSLQARIGQLTVARPLMRLVASIGRDVPVPLLRDLWSGSDPIEPALSEIVEAGLAELKLARRDGHENRLVVRHQLIVDCAYDMVLMRDRTPIHSDIADALERRVAQGISVEPSLRATQLERANRLREAAELWASAGRSAASQSADAEAASLYRRALELIPDNEHSDREWSERFEADTLLALFSALVGAYGYRAVGSDIMSRIQQLIARIGGSQRAFSSLFLRWIDLVVQGDIDTAHELATNLSGIAAADNTGLQQLMLHRMIGSTAMFRGEFADARHHLHAFLHLYRHDQHAEALRQFGVTDNYVTVLCCLAAIEAIVGTRGHTLQAIEQAVAAGEASAHTHTLCHTLTFGASLPAAIQGDWKTVGRYAHRLKEITKDRSLAFWVLFADMLCGVLEVARGDVRKGQAVFERSQETLQAQGFRFMGPTFRVVLALAARDGGAPLDLDLGQLEHELAAGERWLVPACKALQHAVPAS